jgi:hypothetical protein
MISEECYETDVLSKEVFSKIALHSAVTSAVSKALNGGADVNDLEFGGIVLFGFPSLTTKRKGWLRGLFN